jgi:integrase/recombinase XerD
MSHADFLERKSRNSRATGILYRVALDSWAKANEAASIDELVKSIKDNKIDIYDSLDRMVTFLTKNDKAPKSINAYVSGVRAFLAYSDISISEHKFRAKVPMPKQYEVSTDKIPTREELQKLFLHSSLKVKALVSCLCSSGLRIGELLKVKVGQVNFDTKPSRIIIMAKETKNRRTRTVFLTDEAISLLKEHLGDRIAEKDSYIFGNAKPMRTGTAYDVISYACQKAELRFKLDRDSRRYAIHPHVFRKFFMTRLLSAGLDRGVIEALMGHKFGLDSAYLRLTEEEMAAMYLKAMDNLTIMHSGEVTRDDVKKEVELSILHFLLSSGWDDPANLIKHYDTLPMSEKIAALKTMLLRMYHDAGDHTEIREPAELTLQKLEIPLPTTKNLEPATYVISNSQNRFDTVIVESNDNQRLVAYSNRGYEIAGTLNGKILMRKSL